MLKKSWTSKVLTYTDHNLPGEPVKMAGLNASTVDIKIDGHHLPLDPERDTGGAFLMVKNEDRCSYINRKHHTSPRCALHGEFTIQHRTDGMSSTVTYPASEKTLSSMNALGTSAIARVAPTNPAFSLSNAMGELRADGLPSALGFSAWKERTQIARGAGKEYLNAQFGWLPLLNDVRNFASVVKQSEDLLDQYRRDSGKKIRRRYTFPSVSQYAATPSQGVASYPAAFAPGFVGITTQSYNQDIWFSGAFRYHIPAPTDQIEKFKRWGSYADHLLGVKPTPEVVWNLAPWSWAVDWFSNTGDVMTNISNLGRDGMCMQYGYIMHESRTELRTSGTVFGDFQTRGQSATRTSTQKVCQRYKATPYGFGIEWEALSATQLAVVTALGLSRT